MDFFLLLFILVIYLSPDILCNSVELTDYLFFLSVKTLVLGCVTSYFTGNNATTTSIRVEKNRFDRKLHYYVSKD